MVIWRLVLNFVERLELVTKVRVMSILERLVRVKSIMERLVRVLILMKNDQFKM